jgi:hypothetical protein
MNIFKNLFGKNPSETKNEKKTFDIDNIVNSKNINDAIIELDNFLGQLCAYGEDISKLNKHQRIFYLNQCLEREVNNGGFNQYYFNSSGDFAEETVDSLKAIGAEKTATILSQANAVFPNGKVPASIDERQKNLEEIEESVNEQWENIEEKFMAYEDDLNSLNMAYIKNNKDRFKQNT